MKYRILTVLSLLILIFSATAVRATEDNPTYFVTIPEFPININYLTFTEEHHLGYPIFFYKDITYFPLNYHNMEIVGLNMQIDCNKIFLNFEENISPKPLLSDSLAKFDKYGKYYAVTVSPFELYINGEKYEDENYPILFCDDIVYLPLTWDVAVNKIRMGFLL